MCRSCGLCRRQVRTRTSNSGTRQAMSRTRIACLLTVFIYAVPVHAQPRGLDERPIDLPTALRLAHVDNPEIRLARERGREAVAKRQLAAAQFLPTLNVGTNFNHHLGPLQQSTGQILAVNRDSLYLGLGAGAVGAGTVNIPGVVWSANI